MHDRHGQPGMQLCVNGCSKMAVPRLTQVKKKVDGIDNNMNGQTDENTDELCQVDCREGRRRVSMVCCKIACSPDRRRGLQREDDDCDGEIDEGEPCVVPCARDVSSLRACSLSECSADSSAAMTTSYPTTLRSRLFTRTSLPPANVLQ